MIFRFLRDILVVVGFVTVLLPITLKMSAPSAGQQIRYDASKNSSSYPSLHETMRSQMSWIAEHTDLDADFSLPEVYIMTSLELQISFYGVYDYLYMRVESSFGVPLLRVVGMHSNGSIYIDQQYVQSKEFGNMHAQKPLYLQEKWLSLMVHELTHYMVDRNDVTFKRSCINFSEMLADKIEMLWNDTHHYHENENGYSFIRESCKPIFHYKVR